jgi:hypothetical protein
MSYVRFTSTADTVAKQTNVCFVPIADIANCERKKKDRLAAVSQRSCHAFTQFYLPDYAALDF